MNVKRPDKIKMEIVVSPQLNFSENVMGHRRSIYRDKLTEAINADRTIKILAEDKYLLNMFKIAAKKINVKLTFAISGEDLYIKPLSLAADEKRLMLILREPRTLNHLRAQNYELHLENTLSKLAKEGTAHYRKEMWQLTGKGLDLL